MEWALSPSDGRTLGTSYAEPIASAARRTLFRQSPPMLKTYEELLRPLYTHAVPSQGRPPWVLAPTADRLESHAGSGSGMGVHPLPACTGSNRGGCWGVAGFAWSPWSPGSLLCPLRLGCTVRWIGRTLLGYTVSERMRPVVMRTSSMSSGTLLDGLC